MASRNLQAPPKTRNKEIQESKVRLNEGKDLITMSVSTPQALALSNKASSSDSAKIQRIREENTDKPSTTFLSLGVEERKRRNAIMAGIYRAVKETQMGLPALFGTGFGEQHLNQIYHSKDLSPELKRMCKNGFDSVAKLHPRNREIASALTALSRN